jgi:hypothetical protein
LFFLGPAHRYFFFQCSGFGSNGTLEVPVILVKLCQIHGQRAADGILQGFMGLMWVSCSIVSGDTGRRKQPDEHGISAINRAANRTH